MRSNRSPTADDVPKDPEDLLPAHSVLSLEEYLEMQAAIGNRTRFEIVYRLSHTDELTPTDLDAVVDVDDSTLHYHLNTLRDVGLIEKRVLTSDDRNNTYYRSTILGDGILEDGIEELLRREWEFESAYDSTEA